MSYHLHDRSFPDTSLSSFSAVLSFEPVELGQLTPPAWPQDNDFDLSSFTPKINLKATESPSAFYLRQYGGSYSTIVKAVEQLSLSDTSSRPLSTRETQSLLDFNATPDENQQPSPLKKSSILSLFESVESDLPTPAPFPADGASAPLPLPPTPAIVTLSITEDYAFTQKGTAFDQFHLSGKVSSEISTSVTSPCAATLHLIDTPSHLHDIRSLDPTITITAPDIFSSFHDRYQIHTSMVPSAPSQQIVGYTGKPTFKPALLRARSSIAKKDHTVKISVQVQLNTLFPIPFENMQIKVALSSIANHSNVRSKPQGHYDGATKVITWNCGAQCSTRNAALNMELLVEQTEDAALPAGVPILMTATAPSLISTASMHCHAVKSQDEKITFDVKTACNIVSRIKFKCIV